MRLLRAPTALLSLIASAHIAQAAVVILSKSTQVTVSAQVEDASDLDVQNSTISKRGGGGGGSGCANPCGWYGQVCCKDGETCYTDGNNQAACSAPGAVVAATTVAAAAGATGAGSWQYYTSTWVEGVTRTSIWSSWIPATTAVAVATCQANYANGETPCGSICCAGNQYCYATGVCRPIAGYTTEGVSASAPARGTSITGVVVTATISPTTTVPFSTPVATSAASNGTAVASGGGGLSGGAIAGIVIGVLAAIILLILLCLFCCLKAGFDGLLALFGIGKKRRSRRSRVVEEEIIEHRRHGSAAASAEGRRWYGSGYDRPSRPPPSSRRSSQRKTGLGAAGGIAAGLGGLALALGLKRRADRRRREDEKSSSASYSYYDSSYYDSSTSSGSSADRTRRTRVTRSVSRSRRGP